MGTPYPFQTPITEAELVAALAEKADTTDVGVVLMGSTVQNGTANGVSTGSVTVAAGGSYAQLAVAAGGGNGGAGGGTAGGGGAGAGYTTGFVPCVAGDVFAVTAGGPGEASAITKNGVTIAQCAPGGNGAAGTSSASGAGSSSPGTVMFGVPNGISVTGQTGQTGFDPGSFLQGGAGGGSAMGNGAPSTPGASSGAANGQAGSGYGAGGAGGIGTGVGGQGAVGFCSVLIFGQPLIASGE